MYIFNGHSDILTDINLKRSNGEKDVFRKYHYNNFLKSNVKAVIFAIWTGPYWLSNPEAYKKANEIIHSMKEDFAQASAIINIVKNYEDIEVGLRENKLNVIIGMEGLAHIGDRLDLIESYYNTIGLRHVSLTWNEKNMLASGVDDPEGGLTKLGRKAVEKIEELGILLDVSHLNEKSFWDVIEVASGPIIASHSNAKKLANVKRNLSDEQLLAIAETGGLVGINACSSFVSSHVEKQTIEGLIDQIDYIKNLIGIEHISFGFDFCDYLPWSYVGLPNPATNSVTVEGLSSEADIPKLIDRMRERGYTQNEIELIAYKNYERLLEKIFNKGYQYTLQYGSQQL